MVENTKRNLISTTLTLKKVLNLLNQKSFLS